MFVYFRVPEHLTEGIAEKIEQDLSPSALEYKAFLEFSHFEEPLTVYYPACANDDSAAKAFPNSTLWHVDPGNTAGLQQAISSPQHHVVPSDAWEFTPPDEVDVVLLRDDSIPGEDVEGKVTEMLKAGKGFVICSDWAGVRRAENLAQDPNFKLVGFIEPVDPREPHGAYRVNTNVSRIEADLRAKKKAEGELGSVHAGKVFVFRKMDEEVMAVSVAPAIEKVQKSVWGKVRSFFKGLWESVME
jgi:hypothetical protein